MILNIYMYVWLFTAQQSTTDATNHHAKRSLAIGLALAMTFSVVVNGRYIHI